MLIGIADAIALPLMTLGNIVGADVVMLALIELTIVVV